MGCFVMQRSVDTSTSQGSTIILETDSLTAGLRADQSVGIGCVCQKLEHKGFINTLHSFSFLHPKTQEIYSPPSILQKLYLPQQPSAQCVSSGRWWVLIWLYRFQDGNLISSINFMVPEVYRKVSHSEQEGDSWLFISDRMCVVALVSHWMTGEEILWYKIALFFAGVISPE